MNLRHYISMLALIVVGFGLVVGASLLHRKPAPPVANNATNLITFGSRTMTVKEFKAEHEKLAGCLMNLMRALQTNNVEIDRWPHRSDWQVNIDQVPGNTNRLMLRYME